jgi:hypothetical protein
VNRLAAILVVFLAACTVPAPTQETTAPLPALATAADVRQAVQDAPLPQAVEEASQAVSAPLQDAISAVSDMLPPPTPPPPVEPLVAAPAAALIAQWEVGGEKTYTRKYQRPIWPRGQSGVTWCIGYDGGHQVRVVIEDDWRDHAYVADLATTAGVQGEAAHRIVGNYQHIATPYSYCLDVFTERSLVEYERRTRRAFGDGYALLRPLARGALVSLVYNRGGSMKGKSRAEMRAIRDECIPTLDYPCIARNLRGMTRLWIGTPIEKGMTARRDAEAILVLTEN